MKNKENFLKKQGPLLFIFSIFMFIFIFFLYKVAFLSSVLPSNTSPLDSLSASVVKSLDTVQLSSLPGQPIKWVKTIKASSLSNGQHLLEIPKTADKIKITPVTKTTIVSSKQISKSVKLSLSKKTNTSGLTKADRIKLAKLVNDRTSSKESLALAQSLKTNPSSILNPNALAKLNQKKSGGFFSTLLGFFSSKGNNSMLADALEAIDSTSTTTTDSNPALTPAPDPASTPVLLDVAPVVSTTSTTTDTTPIASGSDLVQVVYETPTPVIAEVSTDTGKVVQVSDPVADTAGQHVTNVLAFTTIPKIYKIGQENKIQVKWTNNGDQPMEFHAYDLNNDGYLDYVEWTVPHLSTQTFQIIFISKAFLLDSNKEITADVYDAVKKQDGKFVSVTDGQSIRATFAQILDKTKDNTIYAKPTDSSKLASIKVFPVYTNESGDTIEGPQAAVFKSIDHAGIYKVFLSGLIKPTDIFDLQVSGNVDIDYIVDPVGELIHYKMNDNTGSATVVDSSGNGRDGTAQRNTSSISVSGKIGGGLSFDGGASGSPSSCTGSVTGSCSQYGSDSGACGAHPECAWTVTTPSSCSGTPEATCGYYGDDSSCNSHPQCSWQGTSSYSDCSGFGSADCGNYSGCGWTENYNSCVGYDNGTCTSLGGCIWSTNYSDCSGLGDQGSCTGNGCSWGGGGSFTGCSGADGCGGYGDSWNCDNDPNGYGGCTSSYTSDSCSGGSYVSGGSCSGKTDAGSGSCGGQYVSGTNYSCNQVVSDCSTWNNDGTSCGNAGCPLWTAASSSCTDGTSSCSTWNNDGTSCGNAGCTYDPGSVVAPLDYITASTTGLPSGSDARTVSLWFYANTYAQDTHLFDYGSTNYSSGRQFGMVLHGGKLYFWGNNADLSGSTTVTTGAWHNAILTYDGTTMTIYLDGQVDTSGALALNTDLGTLVIGTTSDYSSSASLNGIVDDFRMYNYAFSQANVDFIFNSGNGTENEISGGVSGPLIAQYKMNDNAGSTNVIDSSGNGLTGTAQRNTSSLATVGKLGGALAFNGSSDYINLGTNAGLNVYNSDFSISAWVNMDSDFTHGGIFGNADSNQGESFNITTNSISMSKAGLGVGDQFVSHSFSPNTWYLVTAVQHFSGGHPSNVEYFVNGTSIGIFTDTQDYASASGYEKWIGYTSYWGHFKGKIDDLRVYNEALTQNDVNYLYSYGVGTESDLGTDLIAHYKLNENAGDHVVIDSVGSQNGTSSKLTSGMMTSGKINNAFAFDGSSDYVDAELSGAVNTDYSISLWAKNSSSGFPGNNYAMFGFNSDNLQVIGHLGDSHLQVYSDISGLGWIDTGYVINNSWHFYNFTYKKSTKTFSVYVDNNFITSWQFTNDFSLPSNFTIGSRTSRGYNWQGSIDDFRIYAQELNLNKISSLYNSGSGTEGGEIIPLVDGSSCSASNQCSSGFCNSNNLCSDKSLGSDCSSNSECTSNNCAASSILAHYEMNDNSSSTNVVDSSGSGFTGTAQQITNDLHTSGKISDALTFNGSSDYISIPNTSALNPNQVSLSTWFYMTTAQTGGLISKMPDDVSSSYRILAESNGAYVASSIKTSNGSYTIGGAGKSDIVTGQWYHAVMTYDGTTEKLYINGTLVDSISASGNITSNSKNLEIGRISDSGPSLYFAGKIDDARVYNYALSASEVGYLYNLASGRETNGNSCQSVPSEIAHYTMDDNTSSTTVIDSDGSHNGTAYANTSTLHAIGIINGALQLAGGSNTGNQITANIPNIPLGDSPESEFAWINTSYSGTQGIMNHGSVTAVAYIRGLSLNGYGGNVDFSSGGGGSSYNCTETGSGDIADGSWHLVGWTYEGGGVATIYVDGVAYPCVGLSSFDTQSSVFRIGFGVNDGNYFNGSIDDVRVYDYALNLSQVNTLYHSVNTAPNVPTLVSPADASYTTDTTPTLSAHYSDPDTGDVGTTNYRISSGTAQNCLDDVSVVSSGASSATSSNSADTTWTPSSTIGSDGTYHWCAQNNDGVLTSSWTSMGSFILDTVAPTVSTVAVHNGLSVDITFSKAMGTGVTTASNYTVSGSGIGTLASHPNSVALVSGNQYRLTWTSGEMFNGGNITITVANAQDLAGNSIGSPNSSTDTGHAVGVAPTGYSVAIDQAYINNANKSAVSFSFASAEVGTTYNYSFAGTSGTPVTGSGTISGASQQITGIDLSLLGEGSVTLSANLTDSSGNIGGNVTNSKTKDTIAPANPSATPAGGTYVSTQSVSLSSAGSSSIYYTLNGDTPTNSSNLYTTAISISSATTLKARAFDLAGNQSSVMSESYIFDITPPIISNVSPVNSSDITTGQAITFTTNKVASCRIAFSDTAKSYDQMSSDCSVTNGIQMSCVTPDLGAYGTKNAYLACLDSYGNKDTSGSATHISYTYLGASGGGGGGGGNTPTPVTPSQNIYTLSINGGAGSTNSKQVNLNFSSSNTSINAVILSTNPDFYNSVTVPYNNSTTSFNLCGNSASCLDGNYIVYAKFIDNHGFAMPAISSSITLKTVSLIAQVVNGTKETITNISNTISNIFTPTKQETNTSNTSTNTSVPQVSENSLQNKLSNAFASSIRNFVFADFPKDFKAIVEKFPKLSSALKKDSTTLSLPGVSDLLKLPTDIVFARTADEKIDLNVKLSLGQNGLALQTLNTIQGQNLKLALRPLGLAKSIEGYLIFKGSAVAGGLSYGNALTASVANAASDNVDSSVNLVLNKFSYEDSGNGVWTADVASPFATGQYELRTFVNYKNSKINSKQISMVVVVDPEGYVYEKSNDGKETRLDNVSVSIFYLNPKTKVYELWPASDFHQVNPQITDVTGRYSFLVPAGSYYLSVTSPDFYDYMSMPFKVEESRGVFMNIELTHKFNIWNLFSF